MPEDEPKDGRRVRGDATREEILKAAERLFAETGIERTPLKDIGVAAGQKNTNAVQYHFGDRDRLIQELVEYRAGAAEESVFRSVVAVASSKGALQIDYIIRCHVNALAQLLYFENHYLGFLSKLIVERGHYPYISVPDKEKAFVMRVMRGLLPHLGDSIIRQRWATVTGTVIHRLASYQLQQRAGTLTDPPELLVEDLISFLTAGLRAPLGGAERNAVDGARDGRVARRARVWGEG